MSLKVKKRLNQILIILVIWLIMIRAFLYLSQTKYILKYKKIPYRSLLNKGKLPILQMNSILNLNPK